MLLDILTPERSIFSGEISIITLPGTAGSFQVQANHAALISTLEQGEIVFRIANNRDTEVYKIKSGVVEVLKNKITVLAEGLEK